jgi:putative holliday junction resolvase
MIPRTGRLLGVDYGSVRVGLAICDPDRILASPLTTVPRSQPDVELAHYLKIIHEEKIVGLVLGLPISLNGSEGPKAIETRHYGDWLIAKTGLPFEYWDERFTSSLADDAMRDAGFKRNKKKTSRDSIAAKILLEGYLEASRK